MLLWCPMRINLAVSVFVFDSWVPKVNASTRTEWPGSLKLSLRSVPEHKVRARAYVCTASRWRRCTHGPCRPRRWFSVWQSQASAQSKCPGLWSSIGRFLKLLKLWKQSSFWKWNFSYVRDETSAKQNETVGILWKVL